jgi:TolB-like protein/DNA-binding winged helix-turn-helix (wHTH) protein/Tfp pilus assembly protein PilF
MSRNSDEKEPKSDESIRIGSLTFVFGSKELRDEAGRRRLRVQSADVLAVLAQNPNQVISKDALISAVWGETCVTEDSLVQCIADIRRALGPEGHALLETFSKKGYRLNVRTDPVAPERRKPLQTIAAVAAALLLAAFSLAFWMQEEGVALPTHPAIAVMALKDLSSGEEQDFLSEAISEGIVTELGRFKEFTVIASTSSFSYRDTPIDVRRVAKELGVHYVLLGTLQKQAGRVRVTVQLVDAGSGVNLWSENYDRELADLFAVQAEIVRTIAASVGFKLAYNPPPAGLAKLSALSYHLEGRTFMRQITKESTQRARELNLKAIAADPSSPYGHIGMAFTYRNEYRFRWHEGDREEVLARAVAHAEKALELDPANYSSHYVRGAVHLVAGEMDMAIARFERSLALNSSATNVMMGLASPLIYTGRIDEGVALIEHAMAIDPHHADWYHWFHAWGLFEQGNCDAALSAIHRVGKLPNEARRTLAVIHVCLGQTAEAQAAISLFMQEQPNHSLSIERVSEGAKYRDFEALERWLDALRLAGLPE